jgi:flagellin
MTTVINTNIASQIAQNYLQNNQAAVTTAITQLSSGLSINSAADNPAGQAIATTLQAQINGQTVAQQNASNGISLAQTGQSALTQITNNLQTIRQLAVQASNASNSAANRAALNQEVQQSLAQINTIAQTTSFNGQNLLDGSFGTQNFQVGANAGQTIGVNLSQGAKTSQIGQTSNTTFSLQGLTTGGLSAEALNISLGGSPAVTVGTPVAGSGNPGQSSDSAYAAATAINNTDITGLTASATNTQTATFTSIANGSTTAATETFNLTINGTNVFGSAGVSIAAGGSVGATTVLNAINAASGTTGVTASLGADGKTFTFNAADGSNISISQGTTGADIAGGLDNTAQTINGAASAGSLSALVATTGGSAESTGTLYGSVTLSSASSISLSGKGADDIAAQAGNSTNTADNLQTIQTYTGTATPVDATAGTLNISGGNLGANVAITVNANDTATTISQSINASATLQAAGISASVNSQGELVLTDSQATPGSNLTITDGGGSTSGLSAAVQQNSYVASASGSLADANVLTVAGAQQTIETVDAALNQVSTLQGQLGAVQNRFTSIISNLTSSVQNAQSTQSSIEDTNYAAATSSLSRAQVLSQAAQAMVAQANQLPQQVLKLLQ